MNRRILPGATHSRRRARLHLLPALFLISAPVVAGTIVNVQSSVGEFKLELYDEEAPGTVAQFLANIEAGNYRFSMIHLAESVLLAGGLFFYESCGAGPIAAPTIPPAAVESTGRQNTVRTIAMVPRSEDPATIGSQWIINLGNNESLYNPAQRPVVFGEVVEGFANADSIADLWRVPMAVSPSVPTLGYSGIPAVECGFFNRENVVFVNMEVEPPDDEDLPPLSAANSFDSSTGVLDIKVDAGESGLLALSLLLQTSTPTPILQVQPETVIILTEAVADMASFDAGSGELLLPELAVDGAIAYRNVLFSLTDPENLFFTLVSAESL